MAYLRSALKSLRSAYRDRGSDLLLARGPTRRVLPALADALGADVVSWGKDYSGLASERDDAVRTALDERCIDSMTSHDAVHHPPGTITTNDGDPYKVFTYFSRKWHDRPKDAPFDAPTADDLAGLPFGEGSDQDAPLADAIESVTDAGERLEGVPELSALGFEQPDADIPPAGYAAARERLDAFCEEDIYRYAEQRDYPAAEATSRLSAALKFGTIGIRDVYAGTESATESAPDESAAESVFEFQDQLAWREFYAQVLWDRPDVVRANYKDYDNPIAWRHDPEALQAWKDGETGYPIVDAGMRHLREHAYMHNRVRMIVASFLTKDLLIDWREGYEWFREKLVDHDTANDNGGWQWAASTGTDSQPYFRIFNPMTQGQDYDPDAEYIKTYVPELEGVPAETIHSWHELEAGTREMHAPEYPAPIVDHAERREDAIAMFERARDG